MFRTALRRRLRNLGVRNATLIDTALADSTWRKIAALDAGVRFVEALVHSRGLSRGNQAARLLERLLSRDAPGREPGRKQGQIVALLKAGGGVGATSLGVQAAYQLVGRAEADRKICFADLDLQFGTAALEMATAVELPRISEAFHCVPPESRWVRTVWPAAYPSLAHPLPVPRRK